MNEFLKFFEEKAKVFPMHLQIKYSKICDWEICVYKWNCKTVYPNARHDGDDVIIVDVQDADMELAFTKAQVQLKEWLSEFNGGY